MKTALPSSVRCAPCWGRLIVLTIGLLVVPIFTGCWPFHREPPQQQFFDALSRGHAAEASQVWLKMSVEDRTKFQRGEGITPRTSPGQVEAEVLRHQADDAKPRSAEGGSPAMPPAGGPMGGWLNIPPEALGTPPNPPQAR